MAASHYSTEIDSGTESVTSTPRSSHQSNKLTDDHQPYQQQWVRLMCSFGGKILPRPSDNQLRYVGGDTRIVAVNRNASFSSLLSKLSKLSGTADITVRYQLPNEDLDALITVTTDEDVENMVEEFERLTIQQSINNGGNTGNHKSARLRLFLFQNNDGTIDGDESRTTSISSLLDGSSKRESFFLDALNGGGGGGGRAGSESGGNGGGGLERGRSEASSVVSEVPDYLFGLDNNSDEMMIRDGKTIRNRANHLYENVPGSDPGSPAVPVMSSPFGSTSSAPPSSTMPPMPNLPPVKTKPDHDSPAIRVVQSTKENPIEGYVVDTSHMTHEFAVPAQHQHQHQQQTTGGYRAPQVWNQYPGPGVNYLSQGHGVQPIPVYYIAAPGPYSHGNTTHVQAVSIPPGPQYNQQYGGEPLPNQVPVGVHQHQATHHGQGQGMNSSAAQMYGGAMRPVGHMEAYDMQGRLVSTIPNQHQPVYYGVRNGGGMMAGYPGNMVPVSGNEVQVQGTAPDVNNGRIAQA